MQKKIIYLIVCSVLFSLASQILATPNWKILNQTLDGNISVNLKVPEDVILDARSVHIRDIQIPNIQNYGDVTAVFIDIIQVNGNTLYSWKWLPPSGDYWTGTFQDYNGDNIELRFDEIINDFYNVRYADIYVKVKLEIESWPWPVYQEYSTDPIRVDIIEDDSYENNNSFSYSTNLGSGNHSINNLIYNGDDDYYSIWLSGEKNNLDIELTNKNYNDDFYVNYNGHLDIFLYNSNQNLIDYTDYHNEMTISHLLHRENLDQGTYYIRIHSDNNAQSWYDFGITQQEIIQPPDVSASDGDYPDKVVITWSESSGATHYRVYRNTSSSSSSASPISDWIPYFSSNDYYATPGETYYYWVRAAKSSSGDDASEYSDDDRGWRKLSPPTGVSATKGDYPDRVRIRWNRVSGGSYYHVYRSTSSSSSSASPIGSWRDATSYDDYEITPGTTYYYWIKAAVNNNGARESDYSNRDQGYAQIEPPAPPTNVSATDGDHTDKVRITWSSSSDATHFRVYRNTSSSSSSASAISGWITNPSYDDGSATPGTTYYYWVKAAKSSSGDYASGYSSYNTGWRKLSPPTGVSATKGDYTDRVQVRWNTVSGASYYHVYRSTSSSSSSASPIGSWRDATSYNDYEITPGTTYYYWIKAAVNNNGARESDYSNRDQGYAQIEPPAPPTNVSATDGDHTDKVRITWSSSSDATHFRVYRNTSSSSSSASAISGWITNPSYDDGSATPGTTYYYWVKAAKSSSGDYASGYSSYNTGWRKLSPPTGVSATKGDYTDRVQVRWNTVSGASYYHVYRSTSSSSSSASPIGSWRDATSYNDYEITPGTTYYYWIKAAVNNNGARESDYSNRDNGYIQAFLTVSPTSLTIGPSANSQGSFTISSNVDWTVSENASWLSVSPTSGSGDGTVTVTATSANNSTSSRSATVTVNGDGVSSETVTVTQAGSNPYLSVSPTSLTIGSSANSQGSFTISSNVDWTVSDNASWLSVSPTSGSGDGTVTVTATSANNSTSSRSATVTVNGDGVSSETVTVTQAGSNPYLSVSPTSLTIGSSANSQGSFTISSNVDWTVSDNASWLSVSPTSGSGDGTVTVTATSANNSTSSRSATVTVNGDGVSSETVTVTQAGSSSYLSVSPTSLTIGSSANSQGSFTISSNVDWTVSDNASWLSVSPTSGSGDGTVTVTATSANNSTSSRSATVTVNGDGVSSETVTVTQAGSNPYLSVSPTSLTIGSSANSQGSFTISSNVDWTVSDNASWLSVSPTSGSGDGTVTVTATSANNSTSSRSATVTVNGDGVSSETVTVTQAGSSSYLSVSPTSLTIGSSANSQGSFTISSNVDWTVSDNASWLSVSPTSGSGDGTVTVTATSANNSTSSRSATVTVNGDGVSSETVTVTQAGSSSYLSVSPTSLTIGSSANSQGSFTISSNVDWTVSDNASWLSVSPTSGSGDGTVTVTATSANNSTSSRSATVTVNGSGVGSETVTVTQEGVNSTRIIRLAGDLNFGNIQVGTSSQRTLTIYNDGNSSLFVSEIICPEGFNGNWSGEIGAGGNRNVPITFSPSEPKNYTGTITVNCNMTQGNNTITCSGTGTELHAKVWPGDTNNDGIVNHVDVLPLGLHWEKTGPVRTVTNKLEWVEQEATPWNPESATYADANGDGIVNQADVLVIGLNWGKTHTLPKLYVDDNKNTFHGISGSLIPNLTYNSEKKEVSLEIQAENVSNLFGLAFQVQYPHHDFKVVSVEKGNLFNNDGIFFYKDQQVVGNIGFGISQKMNQEIVAEKGVVSRMIFKLLTDEDCLGQANFEIHSISANDDIGDPILIEAQAGANLEMRCLTNKAVDNFELFANYPNPFNPTTTITYALPEQGHVKIEIFDLTGRRVKTLTNSVQTAGTHTVSWNAEDEQNQRVSSGIYICRMTAGKHVLNRKLIFAK